VQAADSAVYSAKQAGRNRVEMHGKSAQDKGSSDGSRNLLAPAQTDSFGNIPGAARQERRVSWSVVQLPPFSPVATRVLRLVSRSDASLQKLAELISADPTFSSELLTIVNSALYGQRQPIKDIQQATSLLGLERVKGLAVTVGVRSYFGSSLNNPALQCCWRHSLACAIIAEELAGGSLIDRGAAYTAGILHDIGRVALAVIQPEPYMQFLSETPASPQEILQRERELFEVDHCEAGRRLILEWNLPDEFLDITSRHHVASEDGKRGKLDMLGLVHFSCMLADTLGFTAVRPLTLRNYQELVSELPEQTQRRFYSDPRELTLKIDTKINSVASA
jgi:putative nucleotidyltransferase with HDIG domain